MAATALAAAVIPGCATSEDDAATETGTAEQALSVERTALAADGVPYFIKGRLGVVSQPISDVATATSGLAALLPQLAEPFGVKAQDLAVTGVERDILGMTHVRYQQSKNGLRVVGGDFVVHIAADGAVSSVNGTIRDSAALSAVAVVGSQVAAEVALASTAGGESEIQSNELTYLVSSRDGSLHLAWQVETFGLKALVHDYVFVDALSGEIVDRHPQVFTARNRFIYTANGTSNYPWFLATQIGTETSPPTNDAIATGAFNNTGATYDCYKTLYNRDSFDNRGGALRSAVHVVFPLPTGGTTGNNAAWVAIFGQMVYGDGDGNFMGPTSLGLDVTAHELTHGVTSSTANLVYSGESGALNEGLSDIMAAVCEAWKDGGRISADTWLVGEDIFTPGTAGDALRYMADPTADSDLYPPELGGSRDFYRDRYQGPEDNGGVHLNSGIANLAFQLLTDGGRHPQGKTTFNVPGIGIEKAGAIFQRALTQGYFTQNTNFAQARTLTEQVATELYPGGATTRAVSFAWAAVGVGTPPAGDSTPPTVSFTAPSNGSSVPSSFDVAVTATDDSGTVTKVDLTIDGTAAGSDTSAPFTFSTSGLSAGSHTLVATATDPSGNAGNASITVTVTSPTPDAGVPMPDGGGNPGNPDAGDGPGDPGGCSTSSSPGAASMLLLVGLALALRRRR